MSRRDVVGFEGFEGEGSTLMDSVAGVVMVVFR